MARSAGFCFGVRRAVEKAEELSRCGKVYTIGPIIHNRFVVERLNALGVSVVDNADEIPVSADFAVIRSHGEPPETYAALSARNINYVDCTCPFVTKIHSFAKEAKNAGKRLIIFGDRDHPEVIGINGSFGGNSIILKSTTEIEAQDFGGESCLVVAQTTFNAETYEAMKAALCSRVNNVVFENTICGATKARQREAAELAETCSAMVVLGDRKSSNSIKLYEICAAKCENTVFAESINEIDLKKFSACDIIGVTAGASTPPLILREAVKTMSEFENEVQQEEVSQENEVLEVKSETQPEAKSEQAAETFEEMLEQDGSLVTLHKGAVVKGTVISVVNGEVIVNLGFKSDGIIQKDEFSEDSSVDPATAVKPGDEIDVFIIHVNDKEGNVLLSHKKVASQKGIREIEQAAETGEPLSGKITEAVKGGVIAIIKGARAFVPASQLSNRYIEDITSFIGKELNFQILQYDKAKRRIVAGRKELSAREVSDAKERVFGNIEVNQKLTGVVSKIVDFGAFVDLGGADGLIHISQLSWGRIRKVSEVLKEGDSVTVTVLNIDKEKGKISLTLKDINSDPWRGVAERYYVEDVVTGKVVRIAPFGAFVELEPGVDGLIHVSQISTRRVTKPDDVLAVGDVVDVKIIGVSEEGKKISLSIKALELDAQNGEYYEDEPQEQTEPQLEDVQPEDVQPE